MLIDALVDYSCRKTVIKSQKKVLENQYCGLAMLHSFLAL